MLGKTHGIVAKTRKRNVSKGYVFVAFSAAAKRIVS